MFDDSPIWRTALRLLMQGTDLPQEMVEAIASGLFDGNFEDVELAALLVALRMKPESADEIAVLLDEMLRRAVRIPVDLDALAPVIDTCGSGGSRVRSTAAFNVSTLAALTVASSGVRVCKHGGRAATATSSSADLLESFGVDIGLSADAVAACLAETGIAFCFGPNFHPALRHVSAVRRRIGIPTTFNFLAPLANPARVRRQVIGIADAAMLHTLASVVAARQPDHVLLVHGSDGLDEVTLAGPTTIVQVREGSVIETRVQPEDFGLRRRNEQVRGGDVRTNVALAKEVLAGKSGAHADLVIANAAVGFVAADTVSTWLQGAELARAQLSSGAPFHVLEQLVAFSTRR